MANTTDALVTSIQGSDPQNLMEYITRQKIYNNRFWKEECFGLSAVDVLEKAATSIKCIGGTYGGNQQPTKFLCLVLKLLQIQPETEVIMEFIRQDALKYVRALGVFYLRLTGRPVDIYEELETLYSDYSKLRYRGATEWKLLHMDELVHDLLTSSHVCGIALPRLPLRTTLQEEGYLEEGPRQSKLRESVEHAGGLEEYLRHLIETTTNSAAAIELWNTRHPDEPHKAKSRQSSSEVQDSAHDDVTNYPNGKDEKEPRQKRKQHRSKTGDRKRQKKAKHNTLFKSNSASSKQSQAKSRSDDVASESNRSRRGGHDDDDAGRQSVDYWNDQRQKLGLKRLK
mmetsp:Transcript_1410/g.3475  ORF Transcript_1410/g.3475 Transcript_1410/m.3475 type:complete len:341 (-) Transcript_1410:75-1097(-)